MRSETLLQNEIGKYNSALKLFCTRVYKCTLSKEVPFRLPRCIFYTITSYFTSENFSLRYSDVYDAYAFSQKLKIIIYFFLSSQSCTLLDFLPFNYVLRCISRESSYVEQKKCCWLEKKDVILIRIPFTECRWCRRIPQKKSYGHLTIAFIST